MSAEAYQSRHPGRATAPCLGNLTKSFVLYANVCSFAIKRFPIESTFQKALKGIHPEFSDWFLRFKPMHIMKPFAIALILIGSLIAAANAQLSTEPPSEKDALAIISTHEDINSNLYKIIHITPGRQLGNDGFMSDNMVRVTAFAPASAGRPKREIKQYLMQYTDEYGWFIEIRKEHTRGVYLEISSQKKGQVFVR